MNSGEAFPVRKSIAEPVMIKTIARLEKQITEAGEHERQRIASDLHDVVCQDLAAISLVSALLEKKLQADHSVHAETAGQIATMSKELAVTARDLVHTLTPHQLSGKNFLTSLQRTGKNISAAFPLECIVEGAWPEELADDLVAMQLHRIIHEAMYNAAKHSKGSQIKVRLFTAAKEFTVCISDNGVGFEPGTKKSRGFGLGTMAYRAGLIDGVLKIDSSRGCGTRVSCTISLPRDITE